MSDVQQMTMRQKAILIIIEQHSEGVSREELSELIAEGFPSSRATIIRDLNVLLNQKLIHAVGKGPSTRYTPRIAGGILCYYDISYYFGYEPDERILTEQGVEEFLEQLGANQILFDEERTQLDEVNSDFQVRLASREPDILKRELERFTIELAWKSSRIEGNTYSLLETEQLMKASREAPGHASDEARMILNHKTALELIAARSREFRKLTIENIILIHSTLTSELAISPDIRDQPVGITGTNYEPPARKVDLERYLETAIRIANSKSHPIEAAIVISALIAYLQPFSDGNKRTARLIGNAVLLAHGYAELSYRSVDEVVYKESVILIDEQHSLYWYKRLFIEQFNFTCEKYFN